MFFRYAIVVLCLSFLDVKSQTHFDFEKYSVTFPDSLELPFDIHYVKKRYTPTHSDVEKAEALLKKNIDRYEQLFGKSFRHDVKHSYRQFIGYEDVRNEKHVIIILLRYNVRHAREAYENWKKVPIVGFDGFYERNVKELDVNISTERTGLLGDWP